MQSFKIGADPEIFIRNNGKVVSANGMIPGTKKEPHKVNGGAIQVDGMATEINIDPVLLDTSARLRHTRSANFSGRILEVLRELDRNIKKHDGNNTFARNLATADFDKEYMDSQPEEAKELGCEPDFNAYNNGEQNSPPDAEGVLFRTAAGHIHIGWGAGIPVDNPDHIEICCDIVKIMDAFIGIPSVVLDRDTRRRELYGKAGAFRPKPYGVEYRTVSNFWIFNDYDRRQMYDLVSRSVNMLQRWDADVDAALGSIGLTTDMVQSIINNDDVREAKDCLIRTFQPSSKLYWHWMPSIVAFDEIPEE